VLVALIARAEGQRANTRGLLAPFADVVLADATVLMLHRLLACSPGATAERASTPPPQRKRSS